MATGTIAMINDQGQSALVQLRAYIAHSDIKEGDRLPPERDLVDDLGVTRNDLRKALALLEAEGSIWRHVGKGTFIGPRPTEDQSSIAAVADKSNPVEVMQSRLLLEPMLAGQAALYATGRDIAELRENSTRCRAAKSWREYESRDNALHRSVAVATNNQVLVSVFDTLNSIRRTVVWGRSRSNEGPPPPNHHSFDEHDTLVDAIASRDTEGARKAMFEHLEIVRRKLMGQ